MKIIRTIIIIMLILVVLFFLGAWILISIYGRSSLERMLTTRVGKPVTIEKVALRFPLTISIEGFSIAGMADIDRIDIVPSIVSAIPGVLGVHSVVIDKPTVTVERYADGTSNIDIVKEICAVQQASSGATAKKSQVVVQEAVIHDGRVRVHDYASSVQFSVEPIDVHITTGVPDVRTEFSVDAQIRDGQRKAAGEVTFAGWLNIITKDMDAQCLLKNLSLPTVDVTGKIAAGRLNGNADLHAENNNLTVECRLETDGLVMAGSGVSYGGTDLPFGNDVSGLIFGSLIGPQGDSVFEFSIHTKLDRPRLEGLHIKHTTIERTLGNLIKALPDKLDDDSRDSLEDDVKALGDVMSDDTKKQLGEFEDFFKGVKNIFEGQEREDVDSSTAQ